MRLDDRYDMGGNRITPEEAVRRDKADPTWRRVARTHLGDRYVSTVLLHSDHNYGFEGPPIIFESMEFPSVERCERYATLDAALAGHARMVAAVRAEVEVEQDAAARLAEQAMARRTAR